MIHHRRDYYQIYRVDYRRNHEQMVGEVEGLHEAEKIKRTPCASCTARRLQLQPDTARSSFSLSLVFAVFPSLLQLRVLRLGFLQDGDVGVGIFPRSESSDDLLLRQPDFPHQLSKPWVGTQGVEQEIGLQTHQQPKSRS